MDYQIDRKYELKNIIEVYLQEMIMQLNLRSLLEMDIEHNTEETVLWVENITLNSITFPNLE